MSQNRSGAGARALLNRAKADGTVAFAVLGLGAVVVGITKVLGLPQILLMISLGFLVMGLVSGSLSGDVNWSKGLFGKRVESSTSTSTSTSKRKSKFAIKVGYPREFRWLFKLWVPVVLLIFAIPILMPWSGMSYAVEALFQVSVPQRYDQFLWVFGLVLLVALIFLAQKNAGAALLVLTIVYLHKQGIREAPSSLLVSTTDWFLPWLTLFVVISSVLAVGVLNVSSLSFRQAYGGFNSRATARTVLAASLSILLSSYFWSGVKKLFLGEHVFDWILTNQTQYLVGHATEIGLVPLFGGGEEVIWKTVLLTLSLPGVVVSINFFTVALQLSSIFALFNRKFLAIFLALIELEHLGIFVLTGIFFYKWILVSSLLGVALIRGSPGGGVRASSPLGTSAIYSKTLASVIAASVAISAPLFRTPQLGWWDSPLLIKVERHATVAYSGAALNYLLVPPSFALERSLPVAQSRDFSYVPFLPPSLQTNRALGAVNSRAAVNEAHRFCSNIADFDFPVGLVDEKVNTVDGEILTGLRDSAFARNLGLAFFYPHHIFTGFEAHSGWMGVGVEQIVEVDDSLQISCLGDNIRTESRRSVPIFESIVDSETTNPGTKYD